MDTVIQNEPKHWVSFLPKLTPENNKYSRGHTVIIGGYPITGASRLSAYAAARIGSGLTTLLVPEVALPIYASTLTSIMVKPFIDQLSFNQAIDDARINCYLIGPGAGVNQMTRAQTLALLNTKKPVVLDADAITVFQDDLPALTATLHQDCVLTPHAGEFARLFSLSDDRLASAKNAAKTSGAVIVLKGSETIIASPDEQTLINDNAPPTLATGGSGDVLAGMIAGLVAQGMPPFHAAAAAVWMHGEAAQLFGMGLIAEDLPTLIPSVLKKLQE